MKSENKRIVDTKSTMTTPTVKQGFMLLVIVQCQTRVNFRFNQIIKDLSNVI